MALDMMVPILAFFNAHLNKLDDAKGRARVFVSKLAVIDPVHVFGFCVCHMYVSVKAACTLVCADTLV